MACLPCKQFYFAKYRQLWWHKVTRKDMISHWIMTNPGAKTVRKCLGSLGLAIIFSLCLLLISGLPLLGHVLKA